MNAKEEKLLYAAVKEEKKSTKEKVLVDISVLKVNYDTKLTQIETVLSDRLGNLLIQQVVNRRSAQVRRCLLRG